MKVEVVMKYLAEKLGLSQSSHHQEVRTYTWISIANGRFISRESIIKHACIVVSLMESNNYEVFDKSIDNGRERRICRRSDQLIVNSGEHMLNLQLQSLATRP